MGWHAIKINQVFIFRPDFGNFSLSVFMFFFWVNKLNNSWNTKIICYKWWNYSWINPPLSLSLFHVFIYLEKKFYLSFFKILFIHFFKFFFLPSLFNFLHFSLFFSVLFFNFSLLLTYSPIFLEMPSVNKWNFLYFREIRFSDSFSFLELSKFSFRKLLKENVF